MKCHFEYIYSWRVYDPYIKDYHWYKLPRTTEFFVSLMCGENYVDSVPFDMNDYEKSMRGLEKLVKLKEELEKNA